MANQERLVGVNGPLTPWQAGAGQASEDRAKDRVLALRQQQMGQEENARQTLIQGLMQIFQAGEARNAQGSAQAFQGAEAQAQRKFQGGENATDRAQRERQILLGKAQSDRQFGAEQERFRETQQQFDRNMSADWARQQLENGMFSGGSGGGRSGGGGGRGAGSRGSGAVVGERVMQTVNELRAGGMEALRNLPLTLQTLMAEGPEGVEVARGIQAFVNTPEYQREVREGAGASTERYKRSAGTITHMAKNAPVPEVIRQMFGLNPPPGGSPPADVSASDLAMFIPDMFGVAWDQFTGKTEKAEKALAAARGLNVPEAAPVEKPDTSFLTRGGQTAAPATASGATAPAPTAGPRRGSAEAMLDQVLNRRAELEATPQFQGPGKVMVQGGHAGFLSSRDQVARILRGHDTAYNPGTDPGTIGPSQGVARASRQGAHYGSRDMDTRGDAFEAMRAGDRGAHYGARDLDTAEDRAMQPLPLPVKSNVLPRMSEDDRLRQRLSDLMKSVESRMLDANMEGRLRDQTNYAIKVMQGGPRAPSVPQGIQWPTVFGPPGPELLGPEPSAGTDWLRKLMDLGR